MISYIYRHSINKKKKNLEITLAYEDFILIIHNSIIWNTMLLLYDERRKDELCISNKHFTQIVTFPEVLYEKFRRNYL